MPISKGLIYLNILEKRYGLDGLNNCSHSSQHFACVNREFREVINVTFIFNPVNVWSVYTYVRIFGSDIHILEDINI